MTQLSKGEELDSHINKLKDEFQEYKNSKLKKIKIWHFSDTHTYHCLLKPPEDIDIAIFSGDCSNPRDKYQNEQEVLNFLCWFGIEVKAKYKIFVAGNHDTSIEAKFIRKEKFDEYGIIYLENSSIEIEGLKIWGSPYTPTFGNWSFMRARDKLYNLWQTIPEDSDIVIIHGPPKGILDHSYNQLGNVYERCGCAALAKRIKLIQPKLCLFGHIHNSNDIINAGYIKLSSYKTVYSNGTVVEDGKFGKITSHGNIFEI